MTVKEQIDVKQGSQGFIKVTDGPVQTLSSQQKVVLNRKGNVLFNNGDIEQARRIFSATGYSDGLTRVGDVYMKQQESLKALKQYLLAKNKNKAENIYENMAQAVSSMLKTPNL